MYEKVHELVWIKLNQSKCTVKEWNVNFQFLLQGKGMLSALQDKSANIYGNSRFRTFFRNWRTLCVWSYFPPFYDLEAATKVWSDTYLLTYLLTPCSKVLLEKPTCLPLVTKFPAFYGTQMFITALTSARHLSLPWDSSIQSIPPHPTCWRSILILSSHLCLGLPIGLFPSSFLKVWSHFYECRYRSFFVFQSVTGILYLEG